MNGLSSYVGDEGEVEEGIMVVVKGAGSRRVSSLENHNRHHDVTFPRSEGLT
jgi:hypothetical protein